MRTMCSPAAVSAPNASVSATSPSSNETSVRSTTRFTAATDADGIEAMRVASLTDDRHRAPARVHRVEPADAHRLLGPDVAAREDHLERAPAAEEMRESSRPSGPREDPHRHLGLTEHRAFAPVAQVERGEELGTTTSRGAVDHADRDQAAAMQTLEQRGGDVGLGRGHVLARRDGEDAVHVAVHQEEVGIGAREHDDVRAVVAPPAGRAAP